LQAYERRFPTCPLIPMFIDSDTVSEFKSEDGAVHVIERRCKLDVDAPRLLKRIAGVDYVYFIQKNSLNRRDRTLQIEARNETFSSRVIINEFCCYTVHPENEDWTCFEQSASLDIKSFFGFESTVEKIAMKQYAGSIKKGKEIIEYYLKELEDDGVAFIPRWSPAVAPPAQPERPVSAAISIPAACAKESHGSKEALGAPGSPAESLAGTPDDKLDADYIKRYLGDLTPLQESCLIRLRQWLQETHKGKVTQTETPTWPRLPAQPPQPRLVLEAACIALLDLHTSYESHCFLPVRFQIPKDEHILRFLRARDFNMDKARESLCQSLTWRKQHQVDYLLETWSSPQVLQDYYTGGWHHHDKGKGSLRRSCHPWGLVNRFSPIPSFNTSLISRSVYRDLLVSAKSLPGLSRYRSVRSSMKTLARSSSSTQEMTTRVREGWSITLTKRSFLTSWEENVWLAHMFQCQLCESFQCEVPEGGVVPKALYRTAEELETEDIRLWTDTIYHSGSVFKGSPHELLIEIIDASSVITWDFDVCKGDIVFNIFHSKRAPQPPKKDTLGAHSITSPGGNNVQLIDKSWQLGLDYSMVESPLICKEGESVQGSHVTRWPGFYILQWKFHNMPACATTSLPRVDDVLATLQVSSHKCKVMYYTEVLGSEDFR
ncbi:S14L1 protein, partial [Polyodon spathula]|nr:S14L1 protein [Polyodon spathula]